MSEDVVDLLLRGDIYGNCKADRCMCSIMEDGAEEIKRLRAENEKLRAALKDCADDLEAEINARYGNVHPALQHRYDRDMATVRAAAAALKETNNGTV